MLLLCEDVAILTQIFSEFLKSLGEDVVNVILLGSKPDPFGSLELHPALSDLCLRSGFP